eukprot:GHVN01087244.1.p1 GENE.GHVN01087244.1~~GHVN01087244.1.p1  ORF type:complete len:250 (-),score=34.63 GHVN01087244.1:419-1168(-)
MLSGQPRRFAMLQQCMAAYAARADDKRTSKRSLQHTLRKAEAVKRSIIGQAAVKLFVAALNCRGTALAMVKPQKNGGTLENDVRYLRNPCAPLWYNDNNRAWESVPYTAPTTQKDEVNFEGKVFHESSLENIASKRQAAKETKKQRKLQRKAKKVWQLKPPLVSELLSKSDFGESTPLETGSFTHPAEHYIENAITFLHSQIEEDPRYLRTDIDLWASFQSIAELTSLTPSAIGWEIFSLLEVCGGNWE